MRIARLIACFHSRGAGAEGSPRFHTAQWAHLQQATRHPVGRSCLHPGRSDRVVGSDAAELTTVGPQTVVIDLKGRMAMPGINDAHDHVGGAERVSMPSYSTTGTSL